MMLWIIGAEGLLGKALLKECAARHISAVGTGKAEADITDKARIAAKMRELNPTHIVNCAAYTDVDKAELEGEKAFQINALGAQNAAEVARDRAARFIHISTDFVFDDTCKRPYGEEARPCPVNTYGKSKREGEELVLSAYPEACVIRTSWLFGKGGKNFFSSVMDWLRVKEEVRAVDDQWGCLTYAPDLASAIVDLLGASGIFHFAHPNAATRFEVAKVIWEEMQEMGLALACKRVVPAGKNAFPLAAPRPSFSVLNMEKYVGFTGKRPRLWQEAVKEFVRDAAN